MCVREECKQCGKVLSGEVFGNVFTENEYPFCSAECADEDVRCRQEEASKDEDSYEDFWRSEIDGNS